MDGASGDRRVAENSFADRLVVLGRVVGAFGIRGWIKIQPFSEEVGRLAGHRTWWIDPQGEWSEIETVEVAVHGAFLTARLAGIEVRERAARLKGVSIAVPRSALPAPREGEVYWADLEGLSVSNADQVGLGAVAEVFSNGSHPVLRVRDRDVERLIPFVEGYIVAVDLTGKRITVDWQPDW